MKGLIDSTLREGAQAVGVNFSLTEKKAILLAVGAIGIEELELGIASRADKYLPDLLKYSKRQLPSTSISLWCRCRQDEIWHAAELKPDVLSLSVPASDLHINKKLKKSRQWILSTLTDSIKLAKRSGLKKVSVGLEDASRADEVFLAELICCAQKAGAFRVRLADTVGVATPGSIARLIGVALQAAPIDIGVHTHNDFGMASANAIAALDAGADWADVATLGLGERAGCAKLEEVAGFLALHMKKNYDATKLRNLGSLVAKISRRSISANHPVIGREIFACETGLHLLGLEEDPKTYEPYNPEDVGAKRRLIYGGKIGRKNIMQRLTRINKTVPFEGLDGIFHHLRQRALELGRPLEDSDFLSACGKDLA